MATCPAHLYSHSFHSCLSGCFKKFMPDASIKKLNHRWMDSQEVCWHLVTVWKLGALAPCPRNGTTATQCIKAALRLGSQWVIVPPLCHTMSCRTWRCMFLKVSANCQLSRMQNKSYRIYWDVQRNQLSLQYVHLGWIISCHFSLTRQETGRDSERCPQHLLWGLRAGAAQELCSAGLHHDVWPRHL